uniref:Uncharacterized protein n=1 Tax=Anguilla anguilla TaxID=7936 RepID=A0A0E9QBV0_ANGAN
MVKYILQYMYITFKLLM